MNSKEFADRMVETLKREARLKKPDSKTPSNVFLFKDSTKEVFEEMKKELESNNFTLLDLDQYLEIKPEDYHISLTDAGFADDSGEKIINDALVDDDKKKGIIVRYKLNQLEKVVNSRTVLILTYDDSYKMGDSCKYSILQNWLKDGYKFYGKRSNAMLNALVYCKKEEDLIDFLPSSIVNAEVWINEIN